MISNNSVSRDFLADFPILLDGKPVEKITAFLFPNGGNDDPKQLIANAGKSFQGSIVLGMGFTFDDTNEKATSIAQMQELIEKDARNAERIFPYIGGEEVNGSPTHSHHRYAIDFFDMTEDEAWKYPDLMQIVKDKVKPERDVQKRDALRIRWWQYAEKRPGLVKAIEQCDRVLVIPSSATKYLNFAFVPNDIVFSHKLIIFPLDRFSHFASLQSRSHLIWCDFFSSTLGDGSTYNPSDCFQTFPFPENWETDEALETIGQTYYEFRAALMVQNNQGLTATYNRFHDPEETDPDILKLRDLHSQMDRAVLNAYGWQDIDITCDFRLDYEDEDDTNTKRKKPWRYRWPEATHDEVLARLLTLNLQRYNDEALMGKTKKNSTKTNPKKPPAKPPKTTQQINLIQPETEQLDLL